MESSPGNGPTFAELLARTDYENPSLVYAALDYAALGLRVIPLGERRKRPWMKNWPERGTCDPAQIVRWFECFPASNLGLLTGRGVLALDVDIKKKGFRSFQKELK